MSDANPILPVIDSTIELLEQASIEKKAADQKIAELTESLKKAKQEMEKVVLEKVAAAKAAAKAEIFDDAVVMPELQKLVGLNILSQDGAIKVANRVKSDPNCYASLLVKIAERIMSASDEGHGVDPEPTGQAATSKDPDGWLAMAKGEKVTVRR